ncbi:hypothetical protein [Streptomyces parvulus]|uniref:hypothetical protein n=1 Tax=Streptomyces parvulus TaxID=146923 RepID=UPI00382A0093
MTASSAPVVRARGLTMAYGAVGILHGVDLDVHRDEVLALLGPIGAGRATTSAGIRRAEQSGVPAG